MADKEDLGKEIIEGATGVAKKGTKAAKGALGAVGSVIGGIAAKATDVAQDVAAKAGDVAGDALESAKGAVDGVVDKAADVAEGAIDKAKELAGNLPSGLSEAAVGAAAKVQDLAGDAVDVAKGAAQNVVDAAGGAIEGAVDLVGDAASGAADLAKGAIDKAQGLGAGALGAGAAVIGGAAALAGNVGKGAADLASDGVHAASDAVNAITSEKKGTDFWITLLLLAAIGALAWFGFNHYAGKNPAPVSSTQSATPAWLTTIGDKLKSQFAWLSLGSNGGAVVASGEAADKNAKDAALAAISMEVEASEGKGASVIDNIKVAGSTEAPVGAALAALGANPDVAACSKAFTETMAGRTINFATGKAAVSDDSAALLNALTGIANACNAHKIEVAGHTDSTGDAAANLTLSQSRADAVKAYWVSKGVKADNLTAKGYGATKPLDNAHTDAANAKNRRTEFTVSAK